MNNDHGYYFVMLGLDLLGNLIFYYKDFFLKLQYTLNTGYNSETSRKILKFFSQQNFYHT